jgi:hypothetical protein
LREGTEIGEHFSLLAALDAAVGVFLSAQWIDIGTPESLAAARSAGAPVKPPEPA